MLTELNETNKKLRELDRFKEDMTATLVHDLKTPLSAIVALSANTTKKELQLFKNAGKRMLLLVQNILDVYKYENTALKLKTERATPHSIVTPALENTLFWFNHRELKLNYTKDDTSLFEADKNLLARVVENLMTNAIKYSSKGGAISIKTNLSDGSIIFSITNDGDSIPSEEQENIFERFQQLKPTMLGTSSSTGLGLAFCKMVVTAHHGEIIMNSTKKNGTIFSFSIPIKQDVKKPENKPLEIYLSDDEKRSLQHLYPALIKMEVNEISKFSELSDTIKKQKLGNINWLNELTNAVYSCDKVMYMKLVNMIKDNSN
jgi:signal transduction histidine kinase